MTDGRDPKMERWLDRLGIDWTFTPELDLKTINAKASRANQARAQALLPRLVSDYQTGFEDGDDFPPLLARTTDSTMFVLLGGNHRHAAATKAKIKTLPAYLVTVDDTTAVRLALEDNARHGEKPPTDERLTKALQLIESGLTPSEAAKAVGLNRPTVETTHAARLAKQRAANAGVSTIAFGALSTAAQALLLSIEDDTVFKAAAITAVEERLSAKVVDEMVDLVAKASNRRDRLMAVGDVAEQAVAARPRPTTSTGTTRLPNTPQPTRQVRARTEFKLNCRRLTSAKPFDLAEGCTGVEELAQLEDWCKDTARHLMKVAEVAHARRTK